MPSDTQSRTKPVLEFLRKDASRPVTSTEFMQFWQSCNEADRQRFYDESVALLQA